VGSNFVAPDESLAQKWRTGNLNKTMDLVRVFGLGSQFSYWFLVFWSDTQILSRRGQQFR
jgi:hypothetical protein